MHDISYKFINEIALTGFITVPPVVREDGIIDFRVFDYNSKRLFPGGKESHWCYAPLEFDEENGVYTGLSKMMINMLRKGDNVYVFGNISRLKFRKKNGEIRPYSGLAVSINSIEKGDLYIYKNTFNPAKYKAEQTKNEKRKIHIDKHDPYEEIGFIDDEYNNDAEVEL